MPSRALVHLAEPPRRGHAPWLRVRNTQRVSGNLGPQPGPATHHVDTLWTSAVRGRNQVMAKLIFSSFLWSILPVIPTQWHKPIWWISKSLESNPEVQVNPRHFSPGLTVNTAAAPGFPWPWSHSFLSALLKLKPGHNSTCSKPFLGSPPLLSGSSQIPAQSLWCPHFHSAPPAWDTNSWWLPSCPSTHSWHWSTDLLNPTSPVQVTLVLSKPWVRWYCLQSLPWPAHDPPSQGHCGPWSASLSGFLSLACLCFPGPEVLGPTLGPFPLQMPARPWHLTHQVNAGWMG